jgi:hypothetical protein
VSNTVTHEYTAYDEWCLTHGNKAEGWFICMVDERDDAEKQGLVNGKPYGHRPYELQAIVDEGVFETDNDAWKHVRKLALKGDACAVAALEFLKKHSPPEYEAIVEAI